MPVKPFGGNEVVGVDVGRADSDEQPEREQLDHHHDVVGADAFLRALQQQHGDQHHDRERGHVDHDRDAADVGRAVEEAAYRGIGAQERRAVAGRQPLRQDDVESLQERVEVVPPRDRDGDVADRVLEDEIPADDPRHQLSHRRVGVGVGAAGLWDHRGQLRVAERGQRAGAAEEEEREDERRTRAVADHGAIRADLPRRRGADRAEDPGADDGADRQHDQVARAQHALERVLAAVGNQVRDGLPPEQLIHCPGF
jgi:hypothetical protein